MAAVASTRSLCRAAFADDFDTPTVVSTLLDLVSRTNRYIETCGTNRTASSAAVIEATHCVGSTLRVMGLTGLDVEALGLTRWADAGAALPPPGDAHTSVLHVDALDHMVQFRGSVRALALATVRGSERGSAEHTLAVDVLKECDAVRDSLGGLRPRNVVVRDLPDGTTWHVQ